MLPVGQKGNRSWAAMAARSMIDQTAAIRRSASS
jgi:hypothetical protein